MVELWNSMASHPQILCVCDVHDSVMTKKECKYSFN